MRCRLTRRLWNAVPKCLLAVYHRSIVRDTDGRWRKPSGRCSHEEPPFRVCLMTGYPAVQSVGEPDADPASIPESVVHEIWRLQQFRERTNRGRLDHMGGID